MRDIHTCVRFLSLFLVFSVETEKLGFKNLLEKSFLWSQKKINKYTQWCKKKNEKYTKNLKNYWVGPISNVANYPYNQTKPNYEKIDNHTTENKVWINPRKECETRGNIHIDSIIDKSRRRQPSPLFTVSFFYYNEVLMKWPHHNITEKWHNISFSVPLFLPILQSPVQGIFFTLFFMSFEWKKDTTQIAFNESTIIYDEEIIRNIWGETNFTLKVVPKTVVDILAGFPSSEFYFGKWDKLISNAPWKSPEYLKSRTPRSTIAKAIWNYRATLKKAA